MNHLTRYFASQNPEPRRAPDYIPPKQVAIAILAVVAAVHAPWLADLAAAKLVTWGVPWYMIAFAILGFCALLIVAVVAQGLSHNRQMRRGR